MNLLACDSLSNLYSLSASSAVMRGGTISIVTRTCIHVQVFLVTLGTSFPVWNRGDPRRVTSASPTG